MRARLLLALVTTAVLAGGIAFAVSRPERPQLFYSGGEVHGARPAPDCRELDPPCPAIDPAIDLDITWEESRIAFRFDPPAADANPAIDSFEAVNIAWQEGGVEANSQQAILALVPAGGDFPVDVLVWIVHYKEYCHVPSGNPRHSPQPPTCAYQSYYTMIDAETGEFILSWTVPDP